MIKLDEDSFYNYLKTTGRKKNVIEKYINILDHYTQYLYEKRDKKNPKKAKTKDLVAYVEFFENTKKKSARTELYAIMQFYKSISNKEMTLKAKILREPRKTKKSPFLLKNILDIDPKIIKKLVEVKIKNVNQMINAGKTKSQRELLSKKLKIPYDKILELVKISDLIRVGYIKTKFTRLFYNAGIETPKELSKWDVKELRDHLNNYIKETDWKGIAPFPSDLSNYINSAKKLPNIIEYE